MIFTIIEYDLYTVSDGSEWAALTLKDARRPHIPRNMNCRVVRKSNDEITFPALERLNARLCRRADRAAESGNIFFALFGAVALIGVIGAATTTMLRGPLSTTVLVNNRTKADSQILMAAQLISKASAESLGADCDADGILEPIQPAPFASGPAGAGGIPSGLGLSTVDPWGTAYAYCAYDHGTRDAVLCPGRLAGDATTEGVQIGIISAGPNKQFETTCQDAPDYINTAVPKDLKKIELRLASDAGYGNCSGPSDVARTLGDVATDLKIAATGRKTGFNPGKQVAAKDKKDFTVHP